MSKPRYYSDTELCEIARKRISDTGQKAVADALGLHQPQVSKALAGGSPGVLRRIVAHLTGWNVLGGYNRVEK